MLSNVLQEIVDEIDEDDSGELEFPEFIQLAAKFLIEEDEEQMKWELREAFRIYDKQGIKNRGKNYIFFPFFLKIHFSFVGNGYITTDTLAEILREIDSSLNDYEVEQIVEEVDEDASGTVDFDEFMAMMTGE